MDDRERELLIKRFDAIDENINQLSEEVAYIRDKFGLWNER